MRDIFPTKFYSDEGFVEYKIEIADEDQLAYCLAQGRVIFS